MNGSNRQIMPITPIFRGVPQPNPNSSPSHNWGTVPNLNVYCDWVVKGEISLISPAVPELLLLPIYRPPLVFRLSADTGQYQDQYH